MKLKEKEAIIKKTLDDFFNIYWRTPTWHELNICLGGWLTYKWIDRNYRSYKNMVAEFGYSAERSDTVAVIDISRNIVLLVGPRKVVSMECGLNSIYLNRQRSKPTHSNFFINNGLMVVKIPFQNIYDSNHRLKKELDILETDDLDAYLEYFTVKIV